MERTAGITSKQCFSHRTPVHPLGLHLTLQDLCCLEPECVEPTDKTEHSLHLGDVIAIAGFGHVSTQQTARYEVDVADTLLEFSDVLHVLAKGHGIHNAFNVDKSCHLRNTHLPLHPLEQPKRELDILGSLLETVQIVVRQTTDTT